MRVEARNKRVPQRGGAMTYEEIAERLSLDAAWESLKGWDITGLTDDQIADVLARRAAAFLVTRQAVEMTIRRAAGRLGRKPMALRRLAEMARDVERARIDRVPLESLRRRLHSNAPKSTNDLDDMARLYEESEAA